MTRNLLLWRWSAEYDTPAKRKRKGIKFAEITSGFLTTGDHPAIGEANIPAFRKALDDEFGPDEETRAFLFEDHGKCALVNYTLENRIEIVPKIAGIGRLFGLNASEC